MLTGVDKSILIELHDVGNLSPSILADRTGHHPKSISKRLSVLEDEELVENLGGVWALTVSGTRTAQGLLRDQDGRGSGQE